MKIWLIVAGVIVVVFLGIGGSHILQHQHRLAALQLQLDDVKSVERNYERVESDFDDADREEKRLWTPLTQRLSANTNGIGALAIRANQIGAIHVKRIFGRLDADLATIKASCPRIAKGQKALESSLEYDDQTNASVVTLLRATVSNPLYGMGFDIDKEVWNPMQSSEKTIGTALTNISNDTQSCWSHLNEQQHNLEGELLAVRGTYWNALR